MEEQETTVTQLRSGDTQVYTANPIHIRAFSKKVEEGRASVTRSWTVDGVVDAVQFVIPKGEYDPVTGFKKRVKPLSEEERTRRAAAFRKNVLGTS